MGQQLRKIVKRRRRKAYIARKKALAKSGIVRKASRVKAASPEGDAAKKAPVKKAAKKAVKATAKKAAAKPAEEGTAPAAEE